MDNSDLQNMIDKYKEELIKFAKDNGGYVSEGVLKSMPEAVQTASQPVQQPMPRQEPEDIDELVGTNPDSYNAGRTEPTYRNLDEFKTQNTGEGTLKVQVYSGREAFPVVNARVVVSKDFEEGTHTFYDDMTDISGIVDSMNLSAPPKDMAQRNNTEPVLSTYTIRVTHPYYITTVYTNVPIFDSVLSIQPVNLVPKTGTPADENEIVYVEQEPIDL